MTTYIGVKGWGVDDIAVDLKRAAMLCQTIAIRHVHYAGECDKYPHTKRTIEVLQERGVVVKGPEVTEEDEELPWVRSYPHKILTSPTFGVKSFIMAGFSDPNIPDLAAAAEKYEVEHLTIAADVYARVASLHLQEREPSAVAIPLLARPISEQSLVPTKKAEALRIVFDHMPTANEATPWEAIFDWREDDAAQRQFALLREWINRAARADIPVEEIEDELEARLAEYSSYIKLQHRKLHRGRFELICMAVAQFLEELPKIKITPLLDIAFKARRQHVELLKEEIELNAPGREVAYIAKAQEHLPPNSAAPEDRKAPLSGR